MRRAGTLRSTGNVWGAREVCAFLGALAVLCAGSATAGELVWSQGMDFWTTFYSSVAQNGSGNYEATDDINVIADIDRVVAVAYIPGVSLQVFGAYVSFYAYNPDGTPGVLQARYTVNTGDPGFIISQGGASLDIPLSPPFPATGQHFVSVQPVLASSPAWSWWSANKNNVRGQAVYTRTNNGAWSHPSSSDLAFALYGALAGSSTISSIAPAPQTRSGRISIAGVNFGTDGQVLVDGLAAAVATWTDGSITAYVPEAARLGVVPVQVVTAGGTSAAASLAVTARVADGRLNWRLRMDAPYSYEPPALGPDGTIYVTDVYARLYALSPNGAVKWIVRAAGEKGLSIGPDGTVYTASESDVKAFYPDGTLKWQFVQNPRAFICQDMAVGPDGNIYVGTSEGMGIFSLTPNGQVRWQSPERYNRPNIIKSELAFGLNNGKYQLYFYGNAHLRAVRLEDGASVWTGAGSIQPVVSRVDQSVHFGGTALRPDGTTLWSFSGDFGFGNPDVGSDGTHYDAARGMTVYGLATNGSLKWSRALATSLGDPNVDPGNRVLVLGGSGTLDNQGVIAGLSAANGSELWRVPLPALENDVYNPWTGLWGFNQTVNTRARFSPDSSTAYICGSIADGGLVAERCFLYSINLVGANLPPVANASATPTSGTAPLAVNFSSAGSSDPDGTIASYAWSFGDGGTSTAANPSHTYASAGTFTATLTVTDNSGATASKSLTITANAGANVLRSTDITLTATRFLSNVTVTGKVTVKNQSSAVVSGATVAITWKLPNGSTKTATATTNSSGVATLTVKSGRGTYTLTVNNLTKTGYTYDAANSVLNKSITK